MVWNSVFLMTSIDILIVGMVGYSLIGFRRPAISVETSMGRATYLLVFFGLGLIALFYLADLVIMHVFPVFMPRGEAMNLMTDLHFNHRWLIALVAVGCISLGYRATVRATTNLAENAVKEAEERRKAEARYRRLSDTTVEGVFVTESGRIIDANRAAADLLGYTEKELTNLGVMKIVAPEAEEMVRQRIAENFEGRYESVVVRKDGTTFPVEVNVRMSEEDGRLLRMVCFRDLTEIRRSQEALGESEERLRRSVVNAPIPIMIHAEDGEVLMISTKWSELSGYAHADIPTILEWTEKAYGPNKEERREFIGNVYEMKETFENESHVTTAEGEQRIWEFRTAHLGRLPDGRRFVISMAVDVTERKRAEEEIGELNVKLEERVDERTAELRAAQHELIKQERLATLGQLTATVSHELRNPLGTIRSSLAVVDAKTRESGLPIKQALDRMDRNITRCDRIIEELLDYARAGELNAGPLQVDTWLDNLLEELEVPPGIAVKRELRSEDLVINADRERLRRVVINLYDNACEAMLETKDGVTAQGERILTFHTSVQDGMFKLSATDTGPGIPDDVATKVLEPLFSTKAFGIGLGLPVVKQIVAMHGGKLDIESKVGHGTSVTLRLPLASTA